MLVLLLCGSTSFGHEGATGIVKERMDDMKKIARTMKRINDRLKSKRNFAEIVPDANEIRSAAARMPSLFPAASRDGHTEATASVWQRWPDFVAAARLLEQEAEKLASAAGAGQEALIGAQFRSVARACSGCHDDFKLKR